MTSPKEIRKVLDEAKTFLEKSKEDWSQDFIQGDKVLFTVTLDWMTSFQTFAEHLGKHTSADCPVSYGKKAIDAVLASQERYLEQWNSLNWMTKALEEEAVNVEINIDVTKAVSLLHRLQGQLFNALDQAGSFEVMSEEKMNEYGQILLRAHQLASDYIQQIRGEER